MRPATVVRVLISIGAVWSVTALVMFARGDPGAGDLLAQLLAVSVLAGGIGWVVYRYRILPRRESFEGQARLAGLRAEAGDPLGLMHQPFRLFRHPASARDLENTARGWRRGREIVIADYWFSPSSDATRDDYRRFVCVIDEPRSGWPNLSVVPRSLVSDLKDAAGLGDMDLESDRFDRVFDVRTSDRRFAVSLLDPRMMEWLLRQTPGVGFDVAAGRLMVFEPRLVASIDDVDRALSRFDDFLEHVPSVLASLFPDAGAVSITAPDRLHR